MRKIMICLIVLCAASFLVAASADDNWADTDEYVMQNAKLLSDIATREGPSIEYEEPGTFRKANYRQVAVISRFQDASDICWFQIELEYRGSRIRVYCGRQVNIDPEIVPLDADLVPVVLTNTDTMKKGPGNSYPDYTNVSISSGTVGQMQNIENGFAQFIFTDSRKGTKRLVWVPTSALKLYEEKNTTYQSGSRPTVHIVWSCQPYDGPGTKYKQFDFVVYSGSVCTLYAIEDDFAQIAYNPGDGSPSVLVWIPVNLLEYD